jgi:hypothetical protein
MKSNNTYNVIELPNYLGYYQIGKGDGCLQLCLTEKPKWFHRKMMKICLGIEWFDN